MLEMYKQFYSMNRGFQKGLFLKQGKKNPTHHKFLRVFRIQSYARKRKNDSEIRIELTVIDGKEEMVFQEFGV